MIEIQDLWKTFKLSKKQIAEAEQPTSGGVLTPWRGSV
jgi:hypothetical protein